MHLRKTTSAGVVTLIQDSSSVISLDANKRITNVEYGSTPTTVAVSAYTPATPNDLWEYGKLNDNGFFNVIYTNR
jgi:hypothetical protein